MLQGCTHLTTTISLHEFLFPSYSEQNKVIMLSVMHRNFIYKFTKKFIACFYVNKLQSCFMKISKLLKFMKPLIHKFVSFKNWYTQDQNFVWPRVSINKKWPQKQLASTLMDIVSICLWLLYTCIRFLVHKYTLSYCKCIVIVDPLDNTCMESLVCRPHPIFKPHVLQ